MGLLSIAADPLTTALSSDPSFWTTVGNLTPAGLLTVFVVAILSGRLVPKATKDREVAILTQQLTASETRADVLAETNQALMTQLRVILTGMEAVEHRAKQSPQ